MAETVIADTMASGGDMVVFKYCPGPAVDYASRVAGLPRDRIQIKGGQYYINGAANNTPEYVVPTGDIFAPDENRDNRDNSIDSRFMDTAALLRFPVSSPGWICP